MCICVCEYSVYVYAWCVCGVMCVVWCGVVCLCALDNYFSG